MGVGADCSYLCSVTTVSSSVKAPAALREKLNERMNAKGPAYNLHKPATLERQLPLFKVRGNAPRSQFCQILDLARALVVV